MKTAVIYDFHGTLADVADIKHLVFDKKYDEFYERSLLCPHIEPTVRAARQSYEDDYHNILLTGMPRRYEAGLRTWLHVNEVPMDLIYMREESDGFLKDFVIKHRKYVQIVDLGYYVVRAWEDSPGVINLWGKLGIETVVVPGWDSAPSAGRVDTGPSVS